jgi:hypothetical protein
MTKFNPENKETLTYGECLGPAIEITDQADADQYLQDYVAFIQKALDKEPRGDDMTAEHIAKVNLGYYAGYYSYDVMERVNKLFKCSHPVFGKVTAESRPTPTQAFEAGVKAGKQLKRSLKSANRDKQKAVI